MASQVKPGSEGLLCINAFGGKALPFDLNMKGSFTGLKWVHSIQHFYRAMLESFAFEYGCFLSAMSGIYPHIKPYKIRVIGGGASSDFFSQIKSDVLGLPYESLKISHPSLRGAALLAGNAIGIFPDIKKAAKELLQIRKTFSPNNENHLFYKECHENYKKLLKEMKIVYSQNGAI